LSQYRDDLAWINHHGFSEFAESAAPGVIALLRRAGVDRGLVVDAGCGSGVLARALTSAGFVVRGFDASLSMIDLARAHAPAAAFDVGRIGVTALPSCDAVVAMGEVLNYVAPDEARTFIRQAADAIRPGGLLLFDIAESEAYPQLDERRFGGDDWSVIVLKQREGDRLVRRILTFREIDGSVRRDEEVHTLTLWDRAEIARLLRDHGFRATRRRSYGTRRLPEGHAVWAARRS
jgi:SAM-dependent methyltransferase